LWTLWKKLRTAIASKSMTIDNRAANGKLILKRASKHRSGGPWDDDDYDAFDGSRNIGRIVLHPHAPKDRSWFWTISRFPQQPTEHG
jgi:hypothetical protein